MCQIAQIQPAHYRTVFNQLFSDWNWETSEALLNTNKLKCIFSLKIASAQEETLMFPEATVITLNLQI